ncbi:hypothetical protein PNEG_02318 [Pneumocystis murina B123]|uniref:Rrn9 domain-containing protein n=1 Tax=Pneumocystis murina (strain B123) TaxID=1069680 RepID=M7PFY6_PNEMU|nr:hypothetical protein PNEG_02318 [Pneumocystis murina B123]EMR09369.1 hypothetical protein PNEG_02318 [Pneumocystis murina B123]
MNEDEISSNEDSLSSISPINDDLEEELESSSDSMIQRFSQQMIHKSEKTNNIWAIGSLSKEISEYFHLLRVLKREKAHNLSLHLYSSFKLRNNVHEYQGKCLKRKRWIAWPLPSNDKLDLNKSLESSMELLADELEACIFRIAAKKIHSRHLELISEEHLPKNVFDYIFKIILSRIHKLLSTLLHSRNIQGSSSSKSRLQLLQWDDLLGHASISSAFPFKDILSTVDICSSLFSENISWNPIETPLELENIQYLKRKGWDILSEIPSHKNSKEKKKLKK